MNYSKELYLKYLDMLQLKGYTTLEDINKQYKNLVKLCHPDQYSQNKGLYKVAEEALKRYNIAHEYLINYYNNYNSENFNSAKTKVSSKIGNDNVENAIFATLVCIAIIAKILSPIIGPHTFLSRTIDKPKIQTMAKVPAKASVPQKDLSYLNKLYASVVDSYKNKDYKGTINLCTKIINDKNTNSETKAYIYNLRGLSYSELKQSKNSILNYDSAISLHKVAEFYYNRGSEYGKINKFNNCVNDSTIAISMKQNKAYFYLLRANCYAATKNYNLMIPDLLKAQGLYKQQGNIKKYKNISETINKLKELQQYD
ncbi:MAG: J domain-containing protein [Clostridiaceae bacterium]|jgi:curved DNA-binding protein CbpA|nr:J domain-containing protein [Clostridiaceae bacterium]